VPALSTLGVMHALGQGTAQDYSKGISAWLEAARGGDGEAQYNLASAYEQGKGTGPDMEHALHWFTRAAEQGIAKAQAKVGLFHAMGQGIPEDLVEACKWFLLAEKVGDASAKANLKHAATLLSPGQLKEAERRAEALRRLIT
jgi:hypothetical protein